MVVKALQYDAAVASNNAPLVAIIIIVVVLFWCWLVIVYSYDVASAEQEGFVRHRSSTSSVRERGDDRGR